MNKSNTTEEKLTKTDLRTLWSETLVELLCEAVENGWSEKSLQDIIKELYNKGYKFEQLIKILDRKLGPEAATKLVYIISIIPSVELSLLSSKLKKDPTCS